jgi:hypothetical protein
MPVLSSSVMPNAFSNSSHTSAGSHNSGTVESINANSGGGVDSKVVFPVAVVKLIDLTVTTISRELLLLDFYIYKVVLAPDLPIVSI